MSKSNGRLVLRRRDMEQIVIGEGGNQVVVTVMGAKEAVRLAIESPRHISVDRYEVAKSKGIV